MKDNQRQVHVVELHIPKGRYDRLKACADEIPYLTLEQYIVYAALEYCANPLMVKSIERTQGDIPASWFFAEADRLAPKDEEAA